MTNTAVHLEENEVIRLILQFLNSRRLHKSMRNLERESGVTNCSFTEDVIFLRQLILDGEWDAILTFAKPLEKIEEFDIKKFRYLILKEKFMEVLYFKSGVEGVSSSYSIEDLVKCLNQLEKDCPFKSDYTKLCWLLTVPDLHKQPEYKDWNPETARVKCFREVLELLKNVMPVEKRSGSNKAAKHPSKDRLVTLIIKGLCFESCVDYCHQRAINGEADDDILDVAKDVLGGTSHESTGNFLSWLRSLPQESFLAPFEPMSLDVDFKKVECSKRFQLSNKRLQREAENLSKSLSLLARPSTADNAPRPTTTAHDINTTSKEAELREQSQSALASVSKVSSSYSNFQYRGENPNLNFQPVDSKSNEKGEDIHSDTPRKDSQMADSKDVIGDNCEVDSNSNDDIGIKNDAQQNIVEPTQGIRESQDSIDHLRTKQENNVLKRLEEHELRQRELRQQLMNEKNAPQLSNGMDNGNVKYENMGSEKLTTEVGLSNEGHKNYVVGGESHRNYEAGNGRQNLTQANNENISHSNEPMSRESPVGKEVSPSFQDNDGTDAPSYYAVTSTPLTNKKLKPEPLDFDTIYYEASTHMEPKDERLNISEQKYTESPIKDTQVSSQYPKTPKANILPPGHWIALKDGSGVMNTSTPKSCREKMSNTPGPPASPVGVEANQMTDNNGQASINSRQDMGSFLPDNDDEKVLQHENQENQAVAAVDNPPPRRGPKINGVRRSLVSTGPPMPSNKSATPPEERREAKTPRQEKPTSKNVKQDLKGTVSPRDQKQAVKKISKDEKMGSEKRKNSGTTFVVGKDVPSHASNLTYRKPTNQEVLPNKAKPKSNETTRLMERQREHLTSKSEPIRFCNVASLEDVQAIRAVAFHPSGELFAIGSNSKTLRVCSASGLTTYKKMESASDLISPQPTILFKRNRHHKGSIYCVAWNNSGDLLATGSNDKSIKVLHFDAENCTQIGAEMEMNVHSGTIRDLAFASRSGGSNVIVSGGAGNGNILISDSSTGNTIGQLTGHSGHIMSVFAAKDDIIASGSNDNTVRLWDLRSQRCIDVIATGESCVASVSVNPTCSLLSSGHEDGGCMIYDITAGRTLQFFKPHTLDSRSVRFSPNGHYLLTGSYDTSIILLDMQHNLECNIPPYSVVAQHKDKVIQCRWHPYLMAFVSSSADKTSCLWTLDC